MKEPIIENKSLAVGTAVGSSAITSTHLLWIPMESWILWMSLALTALLLWGQIRAQIIRPLAEWWATRKRAKTTKRRRACDK